MNNNIIDILHKRFATKSYDSTKKISDKDFNTILESGRLSASSHGLEPWKILVIENKEFLNDLYEVAGGARNSLDGASKFLIVLVRKDITADSDYFAYINKEVKGLCDNDFKERQISFKNFQTNDFELFKYEDSLEAWASKQSYIMLGTMINVAALLGIDSCPIEGYNIDKCNALLKKYGVDTSIYGLSYMLSFGYHKGEIIKKTRRDLDEVVQYIK